MAQMELAMRLVLRDGASEIKGEVRYNAWEGNPEKATAKKISQHGTWL